MIRSLLAVAASAVAAALAVTAPASAAPLIPQPVGPTENPPSPAVCLRPTTRPDIAKIMLTPEQESQQTWPEGRLRYPDIWRYSQGAGVVVAVVDSGVDAHHEQLTGRVRAGYDVTAGSAVTVGADTDCRAHGTAVAGIIAARPVAGRAFAGMAPAATILPIRQTWGVDGRGQISPGSTANLIRAINLAVAAGAPIVNVSVVVDARVLPAAERAQLVAAVRNAAAHDVLIVAASDNRAEGGGQQDAATPYPAALASQYDNVIAVGGMDHTGAIDQATTTRDFVSVVAPDTGMPCPMPGGGLVQCRGTSFATPFVSGLAAVLLARDRRLTAAQLKRRIELTADHPPTELPDTVGGYGYGAINPIAALTELLPAVPSAASAAPGNGPLPAPHGSDRRSRVIAFGAAGGATVLVLGVVLGAAVVPRGRRRRWAPGG
ncbi:MAG: S8 family serine peptidase [Actinobacteria bacterium]|nr:S8 family serine peptidase [Actinomycetota bacterium]MBI3688881.1 S8 family serine peptidase [Actinomycetota bacterium]